MNRKIMGDYLNTTHLHDLIRFYFMLGWRHGEILQVLNTVSDISIRMHTLRGILSVVEAFMDT